MNQYGSVVRRLVARNLAELTMPAIPVDLQIANASWKSQLVRYKRPTVATDYLRMNVNSNVVVRELGIFCNFADGLVFHSPANRLTAFVTVGGYSQGSALTGAITSTIGSKALSAVGGSFTTELSVGGTIEDDLNNMYVVDAIADNDNATLTDYALVSRAGTTWYGMSAGGSATWQTDITQLNYMFRQERFNANALFSAAGVQQIGIRVAVQNQNTAATVDFLTKTIDTTYAADTVIFDAIADVEFTYTP